MLLPLRERLCLLAAGQRAERLAALRVPSQERYCLNCQRMPQCSYGRVFEPDQLMLTGRVDRGARGGLRGITLATPLLATGGGPPCDGRDHTPFTGGNPQDPVSRICIQPGTTVPLRLLQLGPTASTVADQVIAVLAQQGAEQGLGPQRARFELDWASLRSEPLELRPDSLPLQRSGGSLPYLRFHLETPLCLKSPAPTDRPHDRTTRRYSETPPTIGRLFRESLRTVRRAVNQYACDDWAQQADLRCLIEAADALPTCDERLQFLTQPRHSARQQRRWQTAGWYGSLGVRNVPLELLLYFHWAGRLGVGDSRNCGAGLWRLELG